MDERGLWELFCKTGLPEAWLALTGEREELAQPWDELAKTAFHSRTEQV